MTMTLEEFKAKYIDPAMSELARKIMNNEPLSDLEADICRASGINVVNYARMYIEKPGS